MTVFISNSGKVTKPFLERITVVRGDVCAQEVGAVATLIHQNMDFKGAINKVLAEQCGYDLDAFILSNIHKPKVGEVYALPGCDLPVRHILLGFLPHYRTEFDMNDSHLSGVVRNMMDLARCMLLSHVAFGTFGKDVSGFPDVKAARLVVQGITDRMQEGVEEVRIVCDSPEIEDVFRDKLEVIGWS